jgi:putative pyruvate formate lyase activating enzyme
LKEFDHCMLCPRACGVNRNAGHLGYCGSDAGYHIGSVCIHRGEEPPVSGPRGICNVFFTRCNLQCIYCQNYQISRRKGKVENFRYTLEEVIEDIMAILDRGIESVGFVSPTHFTPHVKAIISGLHKKGYTPITVYNSNGYDSTKVLQSFEGLIDVYLPDFKYFNPVISSSFSDADDYPDIVKRSIREMYRQKGSTVVLDHQGIAVTGMIIRHLVLPGQVRDSIDVLRWIAGELSPSVSISLMSQYFPTREVSDHPVLNRKLRPEEYQEVLEAMEDLGFTKGWIQQYESADYYKPDFRDDNPFEG